MPACFLEAALWESEGISGSGAHRACSQGVSRQDLEVEDGPRTGTFRTAVGNLGHPQQHPTKDRLVKGACGVDAALDQPQRGADSPDWRECCWTERAAPVIGGHLPGWGFR